MGTGRSESNRYALTPAAHSVRAVSQQYRTDLAAGRYDEALSGLETLRAPADAFFEAVLVNCENDAVRLNRLALLSSVESLFEAFCDVRKL